MTDTVLERGQAATDDRTQYLLDRAEISDVICNYARGVDSHDWTLFRSCFADEIEADFSSLGDMGHFRGSADKWVKLARGLMEALDATQHLMGNIQVEVNGDEAVGRSYLQAQHVHAEDLGGNQYIIAGHYRWDMVRTPQGWRVRRYSLTKQWTSGNRFVFTAAMERAKNRAKQGAGQ